MRNIYCIAAAIIFLFSCKKNVESVNDKNVNSIAGQWTSGYLGNSLRLTIGQENIFSMELPVIVKKESGSKPETLVCTLSGSCVRQDGWYELQTDRFSVLNEAVSSDTHSAILQSITGVDLAVERANAAPVTFRITAGSALIKK